MSETRPDRLAIVQDSWKSLLPVIVPSEYQIRLWLSVHALGTVMHGIRETAIKYQRLNGNMSEDHAVRFASRCMNCRSQVTRQQGILDMAEREAA
jgi:hypothetical protein